MKYRISFWCFAVLPFFFSGTLLSCKKFVTIDPPQTQIEARVIFESDAAATSAATGLYSRLTQTNLLLCSGAATVYPGLSADEFYNTVSNSDVDLFLSNSLVPSNGTGVYVRLWRSAYQNIFQANAVLEGIRDSKGMTDTVKAQLSGEMLFVRSLNYFYLLNLYGAVPYTEETDYRVNGSLPRTPVTEIYGHLVTDLQRAKALLKDDYVSANRARPNRWAAAALLARIYLYQKAWAAAESEASAVIQSGRYSLVSVVNNVFLPTSTETIWQLSRDNNNTGEGFTFIPSSATVRPPYVLTSYLLNAFENTDKRKSGWLGKNTVGGVDYYYPSKYKSRLTTPITEYYVVLRLAEQYLIRAEARTMLNNNSGAKGDIDVIRTRAGLTATTAATQATLLSAIEKERQVELFAEWGHRWLDLIRWGRADAVFGVVKSANWQPTDALYPIPLREVQANPFLTQNPGY